ncbi:hypothetical protein CY34DRAFT_803346 [Suillus luteus UH-Slu-Lm8-n1]|uniref:Unplaced genomic scaffold CY34scaffold_72, whole genome shotgun sequence n=1 Tax=Suillus luteus UH-Slu-Lm8-n1 TaxID=930992 RepID=A0A0D0APX7_9AGAM|nr:hypothetical protein CY34DRAFT_803346 [Suillus luteus UH-Slu-Lm8-n1]
MPRKPKFIPGPSRLSVILKELNEQPRLSLTGLRGISLKLAAKNDHFGARHFVKEELRRIRYANPQLNVEVNKFPKPLQDNWTPEMVVELEDGAKTTIDISNKWSTSITKELMDLAGGDPWKEYKAAAQAAGLPILPGEEKERLAAAKKRTPKSSTRSPENLEAMVENMLSSPDRPKSGAAAILP